MQCLRLISIISLTFIPAAHADVWKPFNPGVSDQDIWNMENQDNDRVPKLPNYWEQKRKAD